jgi:hypothetical protein
MSYDDLEAIEAHDFLRSWTLQASAAVRGWMSRRCDRRARGTAEPLVLMRELQDP